VCWVSTFLTKNRFFFYFLFVISNFLTRIEDTELALPIVVNPVSTKLNARLQVHEIHCRCLDDATETSQEGQVVRWKFANDSLVVSKELLVGEGHMAVINHSVKVVLGRKHVHDVSNVCHFSMWGLCLDRVAGFNFMRTCERKNETNFMPV